MIQVLIASTTGETNNQPAALLDSLRNFTSEMEIGLPPKKREPLILRTGSTTELQLWNLKARPHLTTKSELRPNGGLDQTPERLTHKGYCLQSRDSGPHGSTPQIVGVSYLLTMTPDAVPGSIQHTARETLPTATPSRGSIPTAGADISC